MQKICITKSMRHDKGVTKMEEKKIHFKDLDGGLKTIVVISWIIAGLNAIGFLVGFIIGVGA